MAKTVQIPAELFGLLCRYHLLDDTTTEAEIHKGLQIKLDALAKHQLYTDSKTVQEPEAREDARQKYLDMIGMKDSFRY